MPGVDRLVVCSRPHGEPGQKFDRRGRRRRSNLDVKLVDHVRIVGTRAWPGPAPTLATASRRGSRRSTHAETVREAETGDLSQLSATLADAFAIDPGLQWLAPSQRSERRLRRLIEVELEYYVFPAGRALTTGDFRGASLELPPGRWEMTVPLSAAVGFVRAFGGRLSRARRLQRLFEARPSSGAALLRSLPGCGDAFSGPGAGTALLRPTLDRCDRERVPAYLEASTERSAALYERLGFVHLGAIQVPDGPGSWPVRQPGRARPAGAAAWAAAMTVWLEISPTHRTGRRGRRRMLKRCAAGSGRQRPRCVLRAPARARGEPDGGLSGPRPRGLRRALAAAPCRHSLMKKTIVYEGEVVGNVGCWEQDGRRLVGYSIGREF